ncbi:N-acetylglutamate synthase-like GNAT family acetyltransferase [Methanohalophilus levihalophilus]|uniref:GNAT family N-acetyltransferase n=1 Tax=Methanohalophilus levihalophilus TaxID=1431282 RepID=UPI001AE37B19|nr:GNAT family N-acetyltransferase [Methanohalophilus levihalophilus]MBP2029087.1 N-acetylglutamate synthase-like GNAT family acetyltransferase [Methanohalophilus levihalophilus]
MKKVEIIDTNIENIRDFGICGFKNEKQEGYRKKLEWMEKRLAEGLRYKVLVSEDRKALGAIEYIPGKHAWRPVIAPDYMFIHCIFILKKDYKGKGYGTLLLEECLKDAKESGMKGVAVVTSKGTWMAGNELFLKNGFEIVDEAPPGFQLVARKFTDDAPDPEFTGKWDQNLEKYEKGLTIVTSGQCPASAKPVSEIPPVAEELYGLKAQIVEFDNNEEVQNAGCPFGVFYIVYNGKVIADHPISKTRFKNIMEKLLK